MRSGWRRFPVQSGRAQVSLRNKNEHGNKTAGRPFVPLLTSQVFMIKFMIAHCGGFCKQKGEIDQYLALCYPATVRKRAEEGHCYIEAASHFLEKEGDADGAEALDASPAIFRASGMDHSDPARLYPESLLTARKAAERSALKLWKCQLAGHQAAESAAASSGG